MILQRSWENKWNGNGFNNWKKKDTGIQMRVENLDFGVAKVTELEAAVKTHTYIHMHIYMYECTHTHTHMKPWASYRL